VRAGASLQLLHIRVVLVVLIKPPAIRRLEGVDGKAHVAFGKAQTSQHLAREVERGQEGLAADDLDAEVHQLVGVAAVAGARIDRHVRVALLDHRRGAQRGLHIVDRQHEGARFARLRRVQDLGPAASP